MKRYRFKTGEEFRQFGTDWRNNVHCSFPQEMDFLLNKELDIIDNEKMANAIKDYRSHFFMEQHPYNISLDMLVMIEAPLTLLNSSLFKKRKKVILNQGL